VLAPLVAAAGGIVPMVSGRGLGHTGGTLDKLDAIPGYRWALDQQQFKRVLGDVGCAIIGQTKNFVPADKKLYSLRDVTATVESVPLICGSILSKKIAAGTESLVMDVKCGSGAFMDNMAKARELANGLTSIGRALGKNVTAVLTQMSQPLGEAVGNAIEVREVLDLLRGEGPADVREVTLQLCAEMLVISGLERDRGTAYRRLAELLDGGQAMEKFQEWIAAQGGDPGIADNPAMLKVSDQKVEVTAREGGFVAAIMTRELGVAANMLGAGRMAVTDKVDLTVGLMVHKKPGDAVEKGEPLVTILHAGRSVEEAAEKIRRAYRISPEEQKFLPLILERIE
jgi:pyrimidine-nucleoside phosphorylase